MGGRGERGVGGGGGGVYWLGSEDEVTSQSRKGGGGTFSYQLLEQFDIDRPRLEGMCLHGV